MQPLELVYNPYCIEALVSIVKIFFCRISSFSHIFV
jgi:hypothetical protein